MRTKPAVILPAMLMGALLLTTEVSATTWPECPLGQHREAVPKEPGDLTLHNLSRCVDDSGTKPECPAWEFAAMNWRGGGKWHCRPRPDFPLPPSDKCKDDETAISLLVYPPRYLCIPKDPDAPEPVPMPEPPIDGCRPIKCVRAPCPSVCIKPKPVPGVCPRDLDRVPALGADGVFLSRCVPATPAPPKPPPWTLPPDDVEPAPGNRCPYGLHISHRVTWRDGVPYTAWVCVPEHVTRPPCFDAVPLGSGARHYPGGWRCQPPKPGKRCLAGERPVRVDGRIVACVKRPPYRPPIVVRPEEDLSDGIKGWLERIKEPFLQKREDGDSLPKEDLDALGKVWEENLAGAKDYDESEREAIENKVVQNGWRFALEQVIRAGRDAGKTLEKAVPPPPERERRRSDWLDGLWSRRRGAGGSGDSEAWKSGHTERLKKAESLWAKLREAPPKANRPFNWADKPGDGIGGHVLQGEDGKYRVTSCPQGFVSVRREGGRVCEKPAEAGLFILKTGREKGYKKVRLCPGGTAPVASRARDLPPGSSICAPDDPEKKLLDTGRRGSPKGRVKGSILDRFKKKKGLK